MNIDGGEVKPEKIVDGNISSSSPRVSAHPESIVTRSLDKLPKRIIVPLDGSDFSFRAAKYALNLAGLTGGEIICVHAVVDLPHRVYGSRHCHSRSLYRRGKKTYTGVVFTSKSNGRKRRHHGNIRYHLQSSLHSRIYHKLCY